MGLFSKKKTKENDAVEIKTDTNVVSETDPKIIAVITAAIAAYESGTGATTNLVIRKINRTAGTIPAWGVAGNREQIDTRRM